MKAKTMSLALATLALLSTTGASAQSVEVKTAPVSVGANLVDSIFNPPGSLFELRVLGAGISIGGKKKVVQTGIPGAYMIPTGQKILVGNQLYSTQEFARIIPGKVSLGSARPVHAKVEGPKPMFHFDLFGGRLLEFGPDIAPSMDMRID